jgi:hypothetical protein
MRSVVLVAALAMTGFFAYLTLSTVAQDGVDVLTVVSLLVLALFAFGIVGALLEPPDR